MAVKISCGICNKEIKKGLSCPRGCHDKQNSGKKK